MDLCTRLLLALLLAIPALAQQVWVVDRLNRAGTHFTDLPAAYAAAAPGDVLLLRSTATTSPWPVYTPPPLIDKGVKIVGEHATPTPVIDGNLDIRNLAANQSVVLAGILINPSGPMVSHGGA